MDKVIEQDCLMPVTIEKQALSNNLELHQAESIVWVENDKIPELLKKVSDLFIPEKGISNNSNSEFGSHHWLHTLMGFIKRTGSFIEQHGNSKPDDETLKKWGAQIVVFSQEILDYYTANLKASPTTPATSWEEVKRLCGTYCKQKVDEGEFGELKMQEYELCGHMHDMIFDYLSQHWPSSQPVSPTPMSGTWEEVLEKIIRCTGGCVRACSPSDMVDGECKCDRDIRSIIQSMQTSLHQVDRWIRVEDRLPENDDFVLICGQFKNGIDVFGQTHYYSHGHWYDDNSAQELSHITVTHWQPLPAAPETDKTT